MTSLPVGKVTATPGTPFQLPAPSTLTGGAGALVAAVHIAQIASTTGVVYFGKSNLLRSTGGTPSQGVIRSFQPPAASGFLDSELYGDPAGENVIDPTQFYVDNDNASQGMLVTYFQR